MQIRKKVNIVNYEIITVQDCIENWEKRNNGVILENGQVTGFEFDRRDA